MPISAELVALGVSEEGERSYLVPNASLVPALVVAAGSQPLSHIVVAAAGHIDPAAREALNRAGVRTLDVPHALVRQLEVKPTLTELNIHVHVMSVPESFADDLRKFDKVVVWKWSTH